MDSVFLLAGVAVIYGLLILSGIFNERAMRRRIQTLERAHDQLDQLVKRADGDHDECHRRPEPTKQAVEGVGHTR